MQIITRAQWGAAPPTSTPTRVDQSRRIATCWHYDDAVPVKVPDHSGCAAQIRAIQRFHQGPNRGWNDIGYNFIVCAHGVVFEGRGWDVLGAHAGSPGNAPSIGIQLHIGGDQQPTEAMKRAARELQAEAERRFGRPLALKVHSDYVATGCPGSIVKAWVRAGMPFDQPSQPAQENPVTIPDIGGRIGQRWAELGGPRSTLGNPVGEEVRTETGAFRAFQYGFMIWSLATDARESRGAIREKYADYGYENGPLGYPTSDELDAKDGGKFQTFERGTIYWHPRTGAHAVYGRIYALWASLDHERGRLGYPLGDEFDGAKPGGRVQIFQGGVAYFTVEGDAQAVWGSMLARYGGDGWEGGRWGYPVGPEVNTGNGWVQRFQGGEMQIAPPPPAPPAPPRQASAYVRPVVDPVRFPISAAYNIPGRLWALKRHTGVDIACPTGTPVYATVGGDVRTEARSGIWGSRDPRNWGPYGNYLVINDDIDGSDWAYCHLTRHNVREGQKVRAGDLIGWSGATGKVTGPHLHLERRPRAGGYGTDKNPNLWD